MSTSLRQFRVGLYEEHLEEAAFLYDQRRALASREDVAWTRLQDFEERLEAHLDALIVGDALALEVCRRRAVEGEPGELFAAVCVFCRNTESSLLASVLRELDYGDPLRVQAVVDALKIEMPDAWLEPLLRAVASGRGPIVSLLAKVIGYRRVQRADVLTDALRKAGPQEQASLLWALGKIRNGISTDIVAAWLQSSDAAVQTAALRAGLRMQDPTTAERVTALGAAQCPAIEAGLAGERTMAAALIPALRGAETPRDVIVALGLLGDLASVRPLLALLQVEELALPVAQSLYVITGADLFASTLVVDEMTEEEMFEHEREEFRRTGAMPLRGDGKPFGENVSRLSVDVRAWSDWLQANSGRFVAGRRYRLGRPYDPGVLLQCLESEIYPRTYRNLVTDELLIRYGLDLPMETDMRVAVQQWYLGRARAWIEQASRAVESGRWYLGGRLI